MHDAVATFYGGYDQAGLGRLPRLRIRWIQLAIGVAAVVLLALVAADAYAIASPPPTVDITSVTWYAAGSLAATSAGFTVHAGQKFALTETCELFCYNFKGASVAAPFSLVAVTIVNEPVQYTNLTIQAPTSGYSGVLNITLVVGPPAAP
ncbi:MAG TPA: hypothetical protein VMC82_01655 [Thermoplasmata archaeon]|nr:hypothetical protein [Thermoplasmata archaeon]